MNTQMMWSIILFILTVVFGFWLSRMGKPYNQALFNIHKLIALACVVLAVIAVVNLSKAGKQTGITLAFSILAGLSVLDLFISGAMMSVGKEFNGAMLLTHRIAPAMLAAFAGFAFYLLNK